MSSLVSTTALPPRAEAGNIQDLIDGIRTRIPGVTSIVVSDKDGISILQSPDLSRYGQMKNTNEETFFMALAIAFHTNAEQISKLDALKRLNYLVGYDETGCVIQVNFSPIIITIRGERDVNVGEVIELLPAIKEAFSTLMQLIPQCQAIEF